MSERLKLILSFGFFAVIVVGGIVVLALDGGSWNDGTLIVVLLSGGFVVGALALLPPLVKREGAGGGPNALQWVILAIAIGLWCATPVYMYFASGENIWAASGSGRGRISVIGLTVLTWGTAVLMLVAGIKQAQRAKAAKRQENARLGNAPRRDYSPARGAPGERQAQPWTGPSQQQPQHGNVPPPPPPPPRDAQGQQQRRPW